MNTEPLQSLNTKTTAQYLLSAKPSPESALKWIIVVASYSFLVYKLITFNHYKELAEECNQLPFSQFWWFILVIILLPANWLLEAKKWQMLVSKIQKIRLNEAIKAILSGIFTGFFTPNRTGELVGRISLLKNENRKAGITLSILNSLTQNIIMALCGIPACTLFFLIQNKNPNFEITRYLTVLTISLSFLGVLYYFLPQISRRIKLHKFSSKLSSFSDCLSEYSTKSLLKIMLITFLRYLVFCIQFYLMLRFFNVNLEIWQATIAIPTTYLFVTFTPSLAFSEAAVRSSYAAIIIGAFSSPEIPIILAGVCIWVVNFVFPMLAGSLIMVNSKTN